MAQVKQTQVDRVQSQSNLLKGDPYLINRIVGHHEYTQALRRLERFVRSATEVELVAAEHIVRDEPQYQVYSLYGKQAKDKDDNQDKEKYAYDRDPGLARLMALARVELGAMLAGFAKLRSPFEAVAATPYDMEPFKEFVFEGARRGIEVEDLSKFLPRNGRLLICGG